MDKILKKALFVVAMTAIILPVEIVTVNGYAKTGELIMNKMNLRW